MVCKPQTDNCNFVLNSELRRKRAMAHQHHRDAEAEGNELEARYQAGRREAFDAALDLVVQSGTDNPGPLWAIDHFADLCREYARRYKSLSYMAPNRRANDGFRGAWKAYDRMLELLSEYNNAMAPDEEADGPSPGGSP